VKYRYLTIGAAMVVCALAAPTPSAADNPKPADNHVTEVTTIEIDGVPSGTAGAKSWADVMKTLEHPTESHDEAVARTMRESAPNHWYPTDPPGCAT
jgi:hypothetical protein